MSHEASAIATQNKSSFKILKKSTFRVENAKYFDKYRKKKLYPLTFLSKYNFLKKKSAKFSVVALFIHSIPYIFSCLIT